VGRNPLKSVAKNLRFLLQLLPYKGTRLRAVYSWRPYSLELFSFTPPPALLGISLTSGEPLCHQFGDRPTVGNSFLAT
jgi:hypothetical protein